MRDSFISHANYRYLKLALVLVLASIALYAWHQPQPVANGGTWLGYTLGTLGALLIAWLTWLGIRKRRYKGGSGTLRGWLSAHVWLGLSLLVIGTLHSGFQFGWNIHTLAWALMVAVILSGLWGLFMYIRNPRLMTSNRQQQTRRVLRENLRDLDIEALQIADRLGGEVHHQVAQSLAPSSPPGLWSRLSNRHGSGSVMADRQLDRQTGVYRLEQQLARRLATSDKAATTTDLRELREVLSRRRQISWQLGRDIQVQAQMEFWLYFHVPLSMALLAALLSHIVSVFFYW